MEQTNQTQKKRLSIIATSYGETGTSEIDVIRWQPEGVEIVWSISVRKWADGTVRVEIRDRGMLNGLQQTISP